MEIYGIMLNRSDERRPTENFAIVDFYVDCSEYDRFSGKRYENILRFQVSNSNIDRLDSIKRGDKVKVHFKPQGKKYEKDGEPKHFQSLNAWNIELVQLQEPSPNSSTSNQSSSQHRFEQPANENPFAVEGDDDDLPF